MTTSNQPNSLTVGFAFIGGTGLILMVVAAAIGVVQGTEADSGLLGLLFVGGLVMLVVGIVAWVAVVQPHKHFDDINVPLDEGHEHPADEHAIVEQH